MSQQRLAQRPELLQNRQDEGQGLARAGAGLHSHILVPAEQRQGGLLHRRGPGEALRCQAGQSRLRQAIQI